MNEFEQDEQNLGKNTRKKNKNTHTKNTKQKHIDFDEKTETKTEIVNKEE